MAGGGTGGDAPGGAAGCPRGCSGPCPLRPGRRCGARRVSPRVGAARRALGGAGAPPEPGAAPAPRPPPPPGLSCAGEPRAATRHRVLSGALPSGGSEGGLRGVRRHRDKEGGDSGWADAHILCTGLSPADFGGGQKPCVYPPLTVLQRLQGAGTLGMGCVGPAEGYRLGLSKPETGPVRTHNWELPPLPR